jgi:ribosomal protein L16 Arg81 hydroxylase
MVQRIENNGGVTVSRKRQTVVCHYDDIHNFTFLIYGRKTFLLARPQDVPYGPNKERNVNRSVDTSSSVFRKAVIEPGQLLYLPKDWWHEVPFAYSDTYASFSTS